MNLKKKKINKIKVIYRKLARERVQGWAHLNKNKVEIDERFIGRKKLLVLCHELLHLIFPDASEKKILEGEKILGNTLWEQNYRRIEE